jgi:hypothetical protein
MSVNTVFDNKQRSLFVSGIRQSSWNFGDHGVHTTFTPGRESPITDTYTDLPVPRTYKYL